MTSFWLNKEWTIAVPSADILKRDYLRRGLFANFIMTWAWKSFKKLLRYRVLHWKITNPPLFLTNHSPNVEIHLENHIKVTTRSSAPPLPLPLPYIKLFLCHLFITLMESCSGPNCFDSSKRVSNGAFIGRASSGKSAVLTGCPVALGSAPLTRPRQYCPSQPAPDTWLPGPGPQCLIGVVWATRRSPATQAH